MEIECFLFREDEAGKCSCALPRLWVCSGFRLRPPLQWNELRSQKGDARSAPAGAGLYPRVGRSLGVAHLKLLARSSVQTLVKLANASLSKRTKVIFSRDVGCSKCLATSRNMISAHSRKGNSAIPVPTAGNAIVFSPFCVAMRSECAVELRNECAEVFPPSCMLAACIT